MTYGSALFAPRPRLCRSTPGIPPLRELDEHPQAQEEAPVSIEEAVSRWLKSVASESDSGNEYTLKKYDTAAKQIQTWARSKKLVRLTQITPDALDEWKSEWSPKAKDPNSRIGRRTAGRRLEKVKRFLRYCVLMGWIEKNPASDLKAIKPDDNQTLQLRNGR